MKTTRYQHILILADIEGSSGCFDRQASSFLTREWAKACVEMSKDVNMVIQGLFAADVRQVTVQDFHRTAYNLLPALIDPRARLISGYRAGPVYGVGDPGDAEAVLLIGMHAAAGTKGFLPHTLTSRLAQLRVNGRPLAELELFAASLAPFGIAPIFFSGCPVACQQARDRIPHIHTHPIEKGFSPEKFDAHSWRRGLAREAVRSLSNRRVRPFCPPGPLLAQITVRDGRKAAAKMAKPWGFACVGNQIAIRAQNLNGLYHQLIRLCYLTPAVEKMLPLSLALFRLVGWLGLGWVRLQVKTVFRRR